MQWHTPIGYKVVNGKIMVWEEHRKIVQRIFEDYDNGSSSNKIAQSLKDEGVKNAHDRVCWVHTSIVRILDNTDYLGTEYYPQIIDKELFERVQKRREKSKRSQGKSDENSPPRESKMFCGKIVCAECGGDFTHIWPFNKSGTRSIPKWKCRNYLYKQNVCSRAGFITDNQVEQICIQAVNKIKQHPELLRIPCMKQQPISPEVLKLEGLIREAEESDSEEMNDLLYQRASAKYNSLKVNDRDIVTQMICETLEKIEELQVADEGVFGKIIKKIVVNRDESADVIFVNGSCLNMTYESIDRRRGSN